MNKFEIELSIQKLKISNNIEDITRILNSMQITDEQFNTTQIRLWELKAYYNGLEFAQELYYKS